MNTGGEKVVNPWNLITKYRIRTCRCRVAGKPCGAWFIDDMNDKTGIHGEYKSWDAALDTVIRAQTRQYYSLTGVMSWI